MWNNCKIYNQHGSQIWHVADYMSKLFERLYHAWVLDFRDRYLRWANPAARPWEATCRKCNGECKAPDTQMVLCDHCDAMYNINCLKPKLKKVPKGVWHCPACAPKIGKNRTVTILSAVTEQAARKRAEMGDIPVSRELSFSVSHCSSQCNKTYTIIAPLNRKSQSNRRCFL